MRRGSRRTFGASLRGCRRRVRPGGSHLRGSAWSLGTSFDNAVDDGALREELAGSVGDADVGVDDLFAALEDAAFGEDFLADGAGEVVDVDADGRAEVLRVAELGGGPGGHRAG